MLLGMATPSCPEFGSIGLRAVSPFYTLKRFVFLLLCWFIAFVSAWDEEAPERLPVETAAVLVPAVTATLCFLRSFCCLVAVATPNFLKEDTSTFSAANPLILYLFVPPVAWKFAPDICPAPRLMIGELFFKGSRVVKLPQIPWTISRVAVLRECLAPVAVLPVALPGYCC